ncbi:MAG: hypothetical protein H6Q86_2175 [candidate division NC10 bacterium]|nr:hypothetical protein [candidate division NC10 bacterium]
MRFTPAPLHHGRKTGNSVWKLTVTVAVTWEFCAQGAAHVTLAEVLVRFAPARTALMRASAGPLSNPALGTGVTTATRAPSRAACVTTLRSSHMRLSSTMANIMNSSVGRTRISSSVEVPRGRRKRSLLEFMTTLHRK